MSFGALLVQLLSGHNFDIRHDMTLGLKLSRLPYLHYIELQTAGAYSLCRKQENSGD